MPEKILVIYWASQQSLKPLLVIIYDSGGGRGTTDDIKAYLRPWTQLVGGKPLGDHLVGKYTEMDRRLRRVISRSVSEAQRGRCAFQEKVIVTLWVDLKEL